MGCESELTAEAQRTQKKGLRTESTQDTQETDNKVSQPGGLGPPRGRQGYGLP